jgi:cytoplasmic iron level regulating protein YaaA (DUF328/UPF0246 family)
MLILLPPSETKRDGGAAGTRLRVDALRFRRLDVARRTVLGALTELAADEDASRTALKLGPTQSGEVARNRVVRRSPLMPAIDRYDGVLYDALDAASLSESARAFASGHVLIASALFGLTGALDPIPAYRLSADSRLPGISLRGLWSGPVSTVLARVSGLVLDLRSEGYAALGPAPVGADSVFLRVTTDAGGLRRALNHEGKSGKGAFVRRLLEAGVDHPDAASLRAWADSSGIRLEHGEPGELVLVV